MQKLRGDIENLRLGEESDVTCNAEMRFSETKTRSWVCKDTLGPVKKFVLYPTNKEPWEASW